MDIFTLAQSAHKLPPGDSVVVFNVGQGDHILIKFNNGHYGIIDFYYKKTTEPPGLTFLKQELLRLKTKGKKLVLSFVCISHMDKDHIRGLGMFSEWVLQNFNSIVIENMWLPAVDDSTITSLFLSEFVQQQKKGMSDTERKELNAFIRLYEDDLESFNKMRVKWNEAAAENVEDHLVLGLSFEKLPASQAYVAAPRQVDAKKFDEQTLSQYFKKLLDQIFRRDKLFEWEMNHFVQSGKRNLVTVDRNPISSAILLKLKKYALLFGGDVPLEVWETCLPLIKAKFSTKFQNGLHSDFIKASHHGSSHSSSPDLWSEFINAKSKVKISFSAGTQYKHPHSATIQHIRSVKSKQPVELFSTNICKTCLERVNASNIVRIPCAQDHGATSSDSLNLIETEHGIHNYADENEKFEKLLGYYFHFPGKEENRIKTLYLMCNNSQMPSYPAACVATTTEHQTCRFKATQAKKKKRS